MTRFYNFIDEKAIRIDMADINAMIKHSRDKFTNKKTYLKDMCNLFQYVNVVFSPIKDGMKSSFGVGPAYHKVFSDGRGGRRNMIVVYLNVADVFVAKKTGKGFADYALELSSTIEHELIHKKQTDKMDNRGLTSLSNRRDPDPNNVKAYYGDEHEIMAYANTIIRKLERDGYTQDEMLDMLRQTNKSDDTPHQLSTYIKEFQDKPKILHKLFRYMYEYIIGNDNE